MSRAPLRRTPAAKTSVGARAFRRKPKPSTRVAQRQPARRRVVRGRHGSILGVRAVLARVPAAAWACALIAFLNGAAWSIITPPFQGRDEPAHFAYVQQLAETGTLPHNAAGEQGGFSPQETLVLAGLHQYQVKLSPQVEAISSAGEQRTLTRDVHAGLSSVGSGEAGVATPEPPLYYAVETVPYAIGTGNVLTQLALMRLTSALLAAVTALLSFLFIREVLPRAPWAATIGAACVAIQPLFGFMSGTLNPDAMLYAVSAGLFLCLARGFRQGLSRRLAVTTGALIAAGFITKLNFVGLAPGALAGLILLGVREIRPRGREALRPLALAVGVGASPVMLYALANVLSGKPALGVATEGPLAFGNGSIAHEISYIWQLYLPRLPGMVHYFAGLPMLRAIWFDRSVGLYGWLDTQFPSWVDNVALVVAGAIALLCVRSLAQSRDALRARAAELAIYAAMCVGVLLVVGAASYLSLLTTGGVAGFGDPRYLLPMLPLLGVALTLAVRGAGRRWGPAAGAVIVVAFLAHDLFSQLQVVARYYG